jgi:metal-responsive CopG/Arc/MetJ family transcriptional regulator
MRQTKIGKITASVTLEINQVERLNEIAQRVQVSRSTIVRDAVERELKRYENPTGVDESRRARASGIDAKKAPQTP